MKEPQLTRLLSWRQGTAMAIGSVIGCGILVLPAITVQQAGPASIVSWLIMALLSFPMVITLSRLAVLIPQAGGIAAYVQQAFGSRISAITGWLLLGTIPIGVPSIALTGALYLYYFTPLASIETISIAALMLTLSLYLNIRGIEISGQTSVIIISTIIIILLTTIAAALPHVDLAAFQPFNPYGWVEVGKTTLLVFFSFVGWEMIVPLAEEFKQPARDIPISLSIAALFIAVLYIAISFTTIGTYTDTTLNNSASLSSMMALGFGKSAGMLTAILAVLIAFACIHANIAGFSRLIYAQAREGYFPSFLAQLHPVYRTPIRALQGLGLAFTIVLLVYFFYQPSLGEILKYPSASFLASYIIMMVSALTILNKEDIGWWSALLSLIACIVIYPFSGFAALFPIALVGSGWLITKNMPQETETNRKVDRNSN